jgi:Kef-type K+ transport system membrane component KefB
MEQKGFFSDFLRYNRKILKRLILITIVVLYFAFLITYNHFRVNLNYSVESSWLYGIISALISTVVLIFIFDLAWFAFKKRK